MKKFFLFLAVPLVLSSCGLYTYGRLGGADRTETYYPGEAGLSGIMEFLSGIWYSHYAGIGRLDGYRIGQWKDFDAWGKAKAGALFGAGGFDSAAAAPYRGAPLEPEDYIVLYDGAVYGEDDGGQGGQTLSGSGYLGVVRGINFFNGDTDRGAIIIEYLKGADPLWLVTSQGLGPGEKPFFGIYYRVLNRDTVQMANAVDLEAMYAGDHYYTEKETLEEALDANSVENEAEFISWGVVIPQDRER